MPMAATDTYRLTDRYTRDDEHYRDYDRIARSPEMLAEFLERTVEATTDAAPPEDIRQRLRWPELPDRDTGEAP